MPSERGVILNSEYTQTLETCINRVVTVDSTSHFILELTFLTLVFAAVHSLVTGDFKFVRVSFSKAMLEYVSSAIGFRNIRALNRGRHFS